MGVYGFIRILLPIFPEQIRLVLTPLLWLTVATIVPRDGRFLLVEEKVRNELVLNQPAGHLEPNESHLRPTITVVDDEHCVVGFISHPELVPGLRIIQAD